MSASDNDATIAGFLDLEYIALGGAGREFLAFDIRKVTQPLRPIAKSWRDLGKE